MYRTFEKTEWQIAHEADFARRQAIQAQREHDAAKFIADRMTVEQIEFEITYRTFGSGSTGYTGSERPKFERALAIKQATA